MKLAPQLVLVGRAAGAPFGIQEDKHKLSRTLASPRAEGVYSKRIASWSPCPTDTESDGQ